MTVTTSSKTFMLFAAALLLLVLAFAGVWYCQWRPETIQNVLLISIDTCRADHLSCYGYSLPTTPNIDAIAAEGVLFENAVSPVPLTLPAHASMLTGTIPPYHGIHDNEGQRLGDASITLPELLQEHDVTTGAIIGAFVLDAEFGLNQGFDSYDDRFDDEQNSAGTVERRGEEVSHRANLWLEQHQKDRFFLFLHFYDPHLSYDPPEPFKSRFRDNLYAGEIAYTDHCIGQVLDKLRLLDLYDSTLIVITSDHGESLGEHGEATHGYYMYQSTVKVPLIVRSPDLPVGKRIIKTAGLIDICPTVCGLFKVPVPAEVHGEDLSVALSGQASSPDARTLYCESLLPTGYDCNPLLGVASDKWKYIRTTQPELYDLETDPNEIQNVVERFPQQVRVLHDELQWILDNQTTSRGHAQSVLDSETRVRLESLGYVAKIQTGNSLIIDPNKPDPKALIEFHRLNADAAISIHQKNLARAKQLCTKMLDIKPDYPLTFHHLGMIAMAEQDYRRAREQFSRFVKHVPEHEGGHNNLGLALSHLGEHAEAVKRFNTALSIDPNFARAHYNLARALAKQGDYENAQTHLGRARLLRPQDRRIEKEIQRVAALGERFERARKDLELNPNSPDSHIAVAKVCYGRRDFDAAVQHCRDALRVDPGSIRAREFLAGIFLQEQEIQSALKQYREILQIRPESLSALNSLAWIQATHADPAMRHPGEAVRLARRACDLSGYNMPELLDTLAAAYAAASDFGQATETAEKAVKRAGLTGKDALAREITSRLHLYQNEKAFYESPTEAAVK